MTGFEIIKHVAKDKKQYISYILHYLEYTFDSNQIVDFITTHHGFAIITAIII